jgi:AP-1-like factor
MVLHEPAVGRTMLDQVSLRMENFEHDDLTRHSMQPMDSSKPSTQISILKKLPAYQAPIPLRRRAVASNFNSLFPVSTFMQQHFAASSATCSGDPANCMACADDSFGQAFCAAIGESVATTPLCDGCPCHANAPSGNGGCCSGPTKCALHERDASHASNAAGRPFSGTIPTNHAWRQLKSHPNVAFADLSLLADVVARRSKCTGPRVVISPALGSVTPERVNSPPDNHQQAGSDKFMTDPHTHHHGSEMGGSLPRLIPQELLIECGRQRVREVRADAVRDALHLLDAKFSQS